MIFAGCFLRIRERWFIPGMGGFGYTAGVVVSTVDGTAIAPNQYRPLMPWVDVLLGEAARLPLPTAILASDAVLLALLVYVLHRIARRLGEPALVLGAAAGWAWLMVKIDQWHPEIMLLSVVVATASLLLLEHRPRCSVLLLLGALACGARTDYAAGLGLVVLAVGLHRRQVATSAAGAVIGVAAVASTVGLVHLYPQAHYATSVVQLGYNVTPGALAFVVTFYGVLVALPALAWSRTRRVPPMAPAVAYFAVMLGAVFVVGRVDESRIFMPLAPALGVAAVLAWRELQRDAQTGRDIEVAAVARR